MNLSLRNRIAVNYLIATAIIVGLAFGAVFFVVKATVYRNLDSDLSFEANKHVHEIKVVGSGLKIINRQEWEEKEHREIQVNPVFIQLVDKSGQATDKSPNLKRSELKLRQDKKPESHFDETLHQMRIRQVQIPVAQEGETKGYILAAMSLEAPKIVLQNLQKVLLWSYLILLVILYFISKYLAGRSTLPVRRIIETTERITKENLQERVALPVHKDELFALSSSINELLQRIESALERERQFTSDASHELRTPLASLRGTLEVLIRKSRTEAEYELKVQYCLTEIDRMTAMVEQLLALARAESDTKPKMQEGTSLADLINEIVFRHQKEMESKGLTALVNTAAFPEAWVPAYEANLILENAIANAIKYSKDATALTISVLATDSGYQCIVTDEGIGIDANNMDKLFNRFFRSNALEHKNILGNGLGLAIAQKAAEAIKAELHIESALGKGTAFMVSFKRILRNG